MASNKFKMASGIVHISSIMLWERLTRMKPKSPPAIPPNFDSFTCEWLTNALCKGVPNAKVINFRMEGGSEGTTSRKMIWLEYNDAGKKAGLPRKTFAKATPSFTMRFTGLLSEPARSESRFFNEIRKDLDIEAPRTYFAGYEVPSQRSLIMLEPREEVTYTNPTIYISRKNAEDMMGILAKVHGKFWNSPRLTGDMSWLKTSFQYQEMLNSFGFEERCDKGNERAASVFAPQLMQRKEEIFPCLWKSHELANNSTQTMLHNDVHIGNWYRTPEDNMGLTDWQGLVKGNFGSDLAYAISSALTVEDRRAWEKELIQLYVEKLAEQNIETAPNFDQAWLSYRQQQFHALVFWTFTIGQGALQSEMQPDDFSYLNLGRMSNAIVDLESLDSFN